MFGFLGIEHFSVPLFKNGPGIRSHEKNGVLWRKNDTCMGCSTDGTQHSGQNQNSSGIFSVLVTKGLISKFQCV